MSPVMQNECVFCLRVHGGGKGSETSALMSTAIICCTIISHPHKDIWKISKLGSWHIHPTPRIVDHCSSANLLHGQDTMFWTMRHEFLNICTATWTRSVFYIPGWSLFLILQPARDSVGDKFQNFYIIFCYKTISFLVTCISGVDIFSC